jgi:glutamate synthase (NADPH/NADH) large chain
VGVATQDPVLRARFTGKPEHVINYFFFVAEEARELMAAMGVRRFEDLVGRVDLLDAAPAVNAWKTKGIDLSRILYAPPRNAGAPLRNTEAQVHQLDDILDRQLIKAAGPLFKGKKKPVRVSLPVRNVDRTIGTMLSGQIAKQFGHAGLPDGALHVALTGTAGQSCGAFLARGVTIELSGEANDYAGKGLSGGRLIVRQPSGTRREPTENIIIGNTALYGAVAGEAYFQGVAGERFAVRNSGAITVVEGVGDHGCEYMTGGVVVVLGPTGRNFGAGMSGGAAYVYDPDRRFEANCNKAMVTLAEVSPLSVHTSEENPPLPEAPGVENSGMGDMLQFDAERLRILLERHHRYTGSARAKALLDDWARALPRFIKVMPNDYRRALLDIIKERARGVSVAAE